MTLPCTWEEDARSRELTVLEKGEKVSLLGEVRNEAGTYWYAAEYEGKPCYVLGRWLETVPEKEGWLESFWRRLLG